MKIKNIRMKIMMVFIIFLIILIPVNSQIGGIFATIGMTGLSFVNPVAATAVRGIMCVAGPVGVVTCAEQFVGGKITGLIQGEILGQIAKVSPEAAKAITTYNQVKGYLDNGAQIINELQLGDNGEIEEGTIQFSDQGGEIGNLISEDLEKEDVIVSEGIRLDIKDGVSTFTFTGDESFVEVKGNLFENIKKQDEDTNAYIKLDSSGEIIEADFTTTSKGIHGGIYNLGGHRFQLRPDTRLVYKDDAFQIYGGDFTTFFFEDNDDYVEGKTPLFQVTNYDLSQPITLTEKNGLIQVEGKEFGLNLGGSYDDFIGSIYPLNEENQASIIISDSHYAKLAKGSVASILGIKYEAIDGDINLYYDRFTRFNHLEHANENYAYFVESVYGAKDFVLKTGGSGFKVNIHKTTFDPSLDKRSPDRTGLTEFGITMKGGILDVVVPENHNEDDILIRGEGKFEIRNERIILESNGNDLFTRVDSLALSDISQDLEKTKLNRRMRINFQVDENNFIYELDDNLVLREVSFNDLNIDYKTDAERVISSAATFGRDKIQPLTESIGDKYGVRPRIYFGWVNDDRELRIVNALFRASDITANNRKGIIISPDFLYTASISEGMNNYIEDYYYIDSNSPIRANEHLGMLYFEEEERNLKVDGFLPEDFSYIKRGTLKPYFEDIESGLVAMAATLGNFQAKFLEDAGRLGYAPSDLTEKQKVFWTYLYYNAGEGFGRETLRENGINYMEERYSGEEQFPGEYSRDVRRNVLLRLATWELIDESGIFKTIPSQ